MDQMRRRPARKNLVAPGGWTGVRLRTLRIGADPDAAPRLVTLPAQWEDEAAAALAALVPGTGLAALPQGAEGWIAALAEAAVADDDGHADLFEPRPADARATAILLARALLARRLCALPALWRSPTSDSGVVLNLAAFVSEDGEFDLQGLKTLLKVLGKALAGAPDRPAGCVLLSNLDACLASLGVDYDSDAGRDTASAFAAIVTASLRTAVPQRQGDERPLPAEAPGFSAAPAMLAREARSLWPRCGAGDGAAHTGASAPGPADALLGVESCGIVPAFGAASPAGGLRRSVLSRLAAAGLTPEQALARLMDGEAPLAVPARGALARMHDAVAPYLDQMPVLGPDVLPEPATEKPVAASVSAPETRGMHEDLPDRRAGFTQKVSIGGQRLFLRTGNYPDGRLGEVVITPAREHPATRGLMEAFGLAVSLGLQHGTPLEAFVEAFAHGRFTPQGVVEGDPAVGFASSPLDYVFRTLAESYLHRSLADPEHEAAVAAEEGLLPLTLPTEAPRPRHDRRDVARRAARNGLRLVG